MLNHIYGSEGGDYMFEEARNSLLSLEERRRKLLAKKEAT